MVAGVLVGHFLPSVPRFLDRLQIDGISIPIAILIWIMIYPMMMKVDSRASGKWADTRKGSLLPGSPTG